MLVETPVSETEGVTGFPQIVQAENYVINHDLGDVISQSFSATEQTFPSRAAVMPARRVQTPPGTTSPCSHRSGDAGGADDELDLRPLHRSGDLAGRTDPLVTAVGGTQLHLTRRATARAGRVWNDTVTPTTARAAEARQLLRPPGLPGRSGTRRARRGDPDIWMSAACDGAWSIYHSFGGGRPGVPHLGGTSEATPVFAGVVALADQINHGRIGDLNHATLRPEQQPHNGIVDVTQGDNSITFENSDGNTYTVEGFPALPGYDLSSGVGTVDVAKFAPALAAADHQHH